MLNVIWDLLTVEFVSVTIISLLFGIWVAYYAPRTRSLKGKHVMITGGSSGIGKSFAIEAVERGASVTLLARNQTLLDEACIEISKSILNPSKQKVCCYSVDVSDSYELIEQTIFQAEKELGPVFLLANCAGYAKAAKFEDTSIEEIKRLIAVNYYGSAQISHSVIPGMKSRREGAILFVSSQGGLCGIYGYAAYSASKFALRGLAESLAMELKPYNVTITMGFPPDTDTPGYEKENQDKPEETFLISESSGLHSPDSVAKAMMNDSLRGKFFSTIGVEGFLQSTVCSGMSPITSAIDLITQVFSMGLFRLISAFYLFKFQKIILNCMEKRNQKKRSQ